MNNKTIISAATLTGTLSGYYLAMNDDKKRIPYMLIGGFVGTLLGELLVKKRPEITDGIRQLGGRKQKEAKDEVLWI